MLGVDLETIFGATRHTVLMYYDTITRSAVLKPLSYTLLLLALAPRALLLTLVSPVICLLPV